MGERAFVDTNLFLRFLTDDIPAQAEAVGELLRKAADGELELVTNDVTIAELVWTLESCYALGRDEIREHVLAILNTPGLEVIDAEVVLEAITWYSDEGVDFIDAYNRAWLLRQGLEVAFTFDRRHFSRLQPVVVVRVPGDSTPAQPPDIDDPRR